MNTNEQNRIREMMIGLKLNLSYQQCLRVHRALSSRTRVNILSFLRAKGPTSVSDIVSTVNVAQPTVSRHLSLLRTAGLVDEYRDGRNTYYSFQDQGYQDGIKYSNETLNLLNTPAV